MHTATRPPHGRGANLAAARSAGIALVRLADWGAREAAARLRFEVTSDPLDFALKVSRSPVSGNKGHLVIASLVDTDYSISARIAAALLGAFCTTPKDFLVKDGPPAGIQYSEKVKTSTATFRVAVAAGFASEFPTVPLFLRVVAMSPGSCWKFHNSAHKLCKWYAKAVKETPAIKNKVAVLATTSDCNAAMKTKYKEIHIKLDTFLMRHDASERAVCPGCRVAPAEHTSGGSSRA